MKGAKHMRKLMVLCICILLTACDTAASMPIGTPTFSSGPSSNLSIDVATSTSEPTPSLRITATKNISSVGYQRTCLNIEKVPTPDVAFAGKIILGADVINTGYLKIYSLSPSDGSISLLIDKAYGNVIISPDGRWVAYSASDYSVSDTSAKFFEISSLDGRQHRHILYGNAEHMLFRWLDNQRVVLYSFSKDLLVVDILNGQIQKIDIASPELDMNRDGIGVQGINSGLDRMVYYRNTPNEFPSAVLWDLKNKKELWRLEIGSELLWDRLAQWSPDGSQFVMAGPITIYDPVLELFLVDRNGKVNQLTHFREAGLEHNTIMAPNWSPDGHYIAFWLNGSLAIFDMATKKVTDYCIFGSSPTPAVPNWSPDSKQLVLHGNADPTNSKPVVVVDIEKNRAIQVEDKSFLAEGWMVEKP